MGCYAPNIRLMRQFLLRGNRWIRRHFIVKKTPLLWIIKQNKHRIPAIVLLMTVQIGQALFAVLFSLGTRGVIDSAVQRDVQSFTNACIYQGCIIGGILVCLLLARHLRERLNADLERNWKRRLLHGLLHGDYTAVSGYHSGELLNRLNNDVRKVNEGLLTVMPNSAAMVTRLAAALGVLGALDGGFTLLVVALGWVAILITGLMRRRIKNLNKQVSEQDGKVSGYLQEVLEKLLMVQAMDVSSEVERRADKLLDQRYHIQRKRKNVSLAANAGINLMAYGAGFMALVWCANRMLRGQMSFGSLMAVIQLVNQLQAPFINLSGLLPHYISMTGSAERLMELEEIQGEAVSAVDSPEALYSRMDALCAENLTFSYDREQILDSASFEIPKGVFAVVTGPSGIGKSTVLKLLLGVFSGTSGELFLRCGEERVALNRGTRRLFAYVPQGNLLFSGTLRENLTIIKPDATEEEIRQAVYVSAMDEFLPNLPQGLETVLAEDGEGLSEGQAQRLAIARAVLGGAPILLLDESTSALDADTEEKVLRRIQAMPDRTCIAVTHRTAAITLCNWQLEIDNGHIFTVHRD